jgi:hypothetical protein
MAEENHEREGVGRRSTDEECVAHEKRQDAMDNELHKQSGWFKASAALISIAIIIIGSLSGMILSKLGNIQILLSDNRVAMAQFNEKIINHDKRISDIEERNKFIDQQSGLLGYKNAHNPGDR